MSIKSDKWISEMSKNNKMIEPFSENQVRMMKEGNKLSPMEYQVMDTMLDALMNLKYLLIFIQQ
jgi:deoxycytidine triphosphate deaminase